MWSFLGFGFLRRWFSALTRNVGRSKRTVRRSKAPALRGMFQKLGLQPLEERRLMTIVTIEAVNSLAKESQAEVAIFSVTRTDDDLSQDLTVNLSYSGDAIAGTDYDATTSVTILAGAMTQSVTLTPVDDTVREGTESVIVDVASGGYVIDAVSQITLSIEDNDPNQDPVAVDDGTSSSPAFTVNHMSALNVGTAQSILINDTDPESDSFTASLATAAAHGTVTLDPSGTFTYQPDTAHPFVGVDSFTYQVTDSFNAVSDPATVYIQLTNNAPTATTNPSYSTPHLETLSVSAANGLLNAAGASDADGDTLTASFDATVNQAPTLGTVTINADGSFTYVPTAGKAGNDSFTYQISDSLTGGACTATATIAVLNATPVAVDDGSQNSPIYSTHFHSLLTVAANAGVLINDQDADGSGETLTAQLETPPTHGGLTLNPDGSFSYQSQGDFVGVDSFTYRAVDSTGAASSPVTVYIDVTNTIPTASDLSLSGLHDQTISKDAAHGLLSLVGDGDNDALTVSIATQPSYGTVTLNADGSFAYVPTSGRIGGDSFTYQVTDGASNGVATATVTISITNQDPTSGSPSYSVLHDHPLTVDATQGVLTVATDAESDPLTATLLSGPSAGTIDFHSNGTFTYTPNAGFVGDDTFTYRIGDGVGSVQATATIVVTNTVPTKSSDPSYSIAHDHPLVVGQTSGLLAAANANDADQDQLVVAVVSGYGPSHGTLDLHNDGSFTYTPASGYQGVDGFMYEIKDGASNGTITATATINVTNAAPVFINNNPQYSVLHDHALNQSVTGGLLDAQLVGDPDGDPLVASLYAGPSNGTVSINSDGSFVYTPHAGFTGTDSFLFQVSDGSSSSVGTATITVTDVAPAVVASPQYSRLHDTTLTQEASGGLLDSQLVTDADQDALTASIYQNPTLGTVSINPDGSFTYTPNAGATGTDLFVYQINDGALVTYGVAYVTLTNHNPTATVSPSYATAFNQVLAVGQEVGLIAAANATDEDTDTLTASLISGPSTGSVTINADGSFIYTPSSVFSGTDTFTYQISDGATTGVISLTATVVVDAPIAPTFTIPAASVNNQGQVTISGVASSAVATTLSMNWGDGSAAESVTWNWDGSFSATHNYLANGNISAVLTATTTEGAVGTYTIPLTVELHPENLTLAVTNPSAVYEGQDLNLSGSFTFPNNSDTWTASIEWGDGSTTSNIAVSTAHELTSSHSYFAAGTYTATVTVTNNVTNASTSNTLTINIADAVPYWTSLTLSQGAINEGDSVTLNGQFSDIAVEWFGATVNWGDGSTGELDVSNGSSFSAIHQYVDSGTYSIAVTLRDDDNNQPSNSVSLTVNNVVPTLSDPVLTSNDQPVTDKTIAAGLPLSLTITADDISPADKAGTGTPLSVSIDWGDGNVTESFTVTRSDGKVTDSNGALPTHTYLDVGASNVQHTIALIVTDKDGGQTTNTTTVTVIPTPTFSDGEDGQSHEGLGITDTINEGSPLTVTLPIQASPSLTFTTSVNWGDNSTADAAQLTHTFWNNKTTSSDGINPDPYLVDVTLTDNQGRTYHYYRLVQVNNVAPTMNTAGTDFGGQCADAELPPIPTTFDFTDPGKNNPTATQPDDGNKILYSIDDATPSETLGALPTTVGNHTVSVVVSDQDGKTSTPINFTYGILPEATWDQVFDPNPPSPTDIATGETAESFTAPTDSAPSYPTDEDTLLTVTKEQGVLKGATATHSTEYHYHSEAPWEYKLKDSDGNIITNAAGYCVHDPMPTPGSGNDGEDYDHWVEGAVTLTAVLKTGPSHAATNGFTFYPDGSFSYLPEANWNGTDSFTFVLDNGSVQDSVVYTVTLAVNAVNDPPSFTSGGDKTVNEDSGAASFDNWATNISAGADNEGTQTLTFTVTPTDTSLFTTEGQPAIDSTGKLTFTPAQDAYGSTTVTVTLNDGSANSSSETFTISINAVNDAPSFTKGDDISVYPYSGAKTYTGWVKSSSAGPSNESNQTLSYEVTAVNPGLFSAQPTIDSAGTLTFTPATTATGASDVTVKIKDSGGVDNAGVDTSALQTFTITFKSLPTLSVSDATINEGEAGTKTLDFTVSLSEAVDYDVTFQATTEDGTAKVIDNDYTALSGASAAFIIAKDTDSVVVSVTIQDDAIYEGNETLKLILSSIVGATETDTEGAGTIVDDETAPTVTVGDSSALEGDTIVFTVNLSNASATPTTVYYSTTDGTAKAATDFTAPGAGAYIEIPALSTSATISISTSPDSKYETDEAFTLNVSLDDLSSDEATGTINDDDLMPTLSISPVAKDEGTATASTSFDFVVDVIGETELPITFSWATVEGTAQSGDDYTAVGDRITLQPTQSSVTLSVPVVADGRYENDETFQVELSNASGATIPGDGLATGTIRNDDTFPTVGIAATVASTVEGDTVTPGVFTITRSGGDRSQSLDVYYSVSGTASQDDFDTDAIASGYVTILANEDSATVDISAFADQLLDDGETVILTLEVDSTIAPNYQIDSQHAMDTVTIIDNTQSVSVTATTPTTKEGDTVSPGVFTFTRSGRDLSEALVVSYFIDDSQPDDASEDEYDTTQLTETVTFEPNATTATIEVYAKWDDLTEGDENARLSITGTTPIAPTGSGDATIVIQDVVKPTLSVSDTSVAEGNAGDTNTLQFTVSLTSPAPQDVTFTVATRVNSGSDVDPAESTDYTALEPTTYTITAGQTSIVIPVSVSGDAIYEGGETLQLVISNVQNAYLGDDVGIGTITNDDAAPTLSISPVSQSEGTGTTPTNFEFVVEVTGETELPITFSWATADGTAISDEDDYTAVSNTITLQPTQSSTTLTVSAMADSSMEQDETFSVELSELVGATATNSTSTGTIEDDDTPPIRIEPVSDYEGDASTKSFDFLVTLDQPAPTDMVVYYHVEPYGDNPATLDLDYSVSPSGYITIASGQTTGAISVAVIGDYVYEGDETFRVVIDSAGLIAVPADTNAIGTIQDDDSNVEVTVDPMVIREGDSDHPGQFTISRTGYVDADLFVEYAITADSTASPNDYDAPNLYGTALIPRGQTSFTIDVTALKDELQEGTETLSIAIVSVSDNRFTYSPYAATLEIEDDYQGIKDELCGCSADQSVDDQSGEMGMNADTGTDMDMTFGSDDMSDPIIGNDWDVPDDAPETIRANLTFGGQASTPVYYSTVNFTGTAARITVAANAAGLPTGTHEYTLQLTDANTGTVLRTFHGQQQYVNRQDSPYGQGWWIQGLTQLVVSQQNSLDVTFVASDGSAALYRSAGHGQFQTPGGYNDKLVRNNDGTFTLTDPQGNQQRFDTTGLLTSRSDSHGNTTTYTYTAGKLLTVTTPQGHWTTLNYDVNGKLQSISDYLGRTADFTITDGHLISIERPATDESGDRATMTYQYDESGRVTSRTNVMGKTSTYQFDSAGRVTQVIDGGNRSHTYSAYQTLGLVDLATGVGGINQPAPLFNHANLIASRYDGTTLKEYRTDRYGNIVWERDALGTVHQYDRDGQGNILAQHDPDPNSAGNFLVTHHTYDAKGNRLSTTYPDGSTESWTYDATWNQVTQHVDPLGRITLSAYDPANGNLLSQTQVIGQVDSIDNSQPDETTSYTYDARGNMLTQTDPLGNTTMYTYDEHGNQTSVTDPLGNVTLYGYDSHDRLIASTVVIGQLDSNSGEHDDRVTLTSYNAAGRVASTTDPLGHVTQFQYDYLGREIKRTEIIGQLDGSGNGEHNDRLTTTQYTTAQVTLDNGETITGNRTIVTDLLGNVTIRQYDDHQHLIAQTDAMGRTTHYIVDDEGRQTDVIDPAGVRTHTELDELGRQVLSSLVVGQLDSEANSETDDLVTRYEYDAQGRQIQMTDPAGRITRFEYDAQGRQTKVIQQVGTLDAPTATNGDDLVTQNIYDAAGQLVESIDPMGRHTQYTYDEAGRQIATRQVVGNVDSTSNGEHNDVVAQSVYDAAGRLIESIDPLGRRTLYSYDAAGRQTATRQVFGQVDLTSNEQDDIVSQTVYDSAGEVVESIDPLGHHLLTSYDLLGRTTRVRQVIGQNDLTSSESNDLVTTLQYVTLANGNTQQISTDPLGRVTTTTFDRLGRAIQATDPTGAVTSMSYNAAGQVVSVTDPLGRTTHTTYDSAGRVASVTDPSGRTVTTHYDSLGRVDHTIDSLAGTSSTTFLSNGLVDKVTDAQGHFTQYGYDALGRVVSSTDSLAGSTTIVLNKDGSVASQTDPLGHTTSFGYDALGRRTTVTNVAGTTTTTFDAAGQVVAITDPLGHVTTHHYDAAGRLTSTTDPESGTTSYSYDKLGNRTALTDPVGNTTTWTYNELGLMATDSIRTGTDNQGQPLYATRSYIYDNVGELTQYTDRNGRVTQYDYDLLGHKAAERWLDGSTVVNTLTWAYDAAGQLTNCTTPDSQESFAYNLLGQLTTISIANANVPTVVLIPGYNAHGNRKSLTALVDGVVTVSNTYTFDAIDQMLSVQQQGPNLTTKLVSFGYNALGQMTTISRATAANGNYALVSGSLNEYDAAGRLSNLTYTSSTGSTQAAYSWTYDAANRITQFNDLLHTDQSATYSYDTTNQLTGADHTGTSLDESFNWDTNGNPSGSQYVIGWNNQLLADGTYQYTYDAEGNRTSKTEIASGTRTDYVWDYRNHLVEETQHSSSGAALFDVRYGYDALNQRISRSTQDGVIEHFVYDGQNVLLDLTDPDGAGSTPATVSAVYLYGPSVDQLLSQENVGTGSNTDLWQLVDNLGSVRAIANNSGTVIANLAYDAFGARAQATVDIAVGLHTRYLYTSRDFDPITGEQFNRERYYDYHARRWLSNDPILDQGDPSNWYRYVGNEPTLFTDPSGFENYVENPYAKYGPGLKPNWNRGAGPLHYTQFRLTMKVPCKYASQSSNIVDDIYAHLKSFDLFNGGNNGVARVSVSGDIARFDELGWFFNWSSPLAGNEDKVPVRLSFNDATREVMGQTLDDHMLVGVRKWRVIGPMDSPKGKEDGFYVLVETDSYERMQNRRNLAGFRIMGSDDQKAVWQGYLRNILDEYESQYQAKWENKSELIPGVMKDMGYGPNPWGPADQYVPPQPPPLPPIGITGKPTMLN